jgi:hypothetical protein
LRRQGMFLAALFIWNEVGAICRIWSAEWL